MEEKIEKESKTFGANATAVGPEGGMPDPLQSAETGSKATAGGGATGGAPKVMVVIPPDLHEYARREALLQGAKLTERYRLSEMFVKIHEVRAWRSGSVVFVVVRATERACKRVCTGWAKCRTGESFDKRRGVSLAVNRAVRQLLRLKPKRSKDPTLFDIMEKRWL